MPEAGRRPARTGRERRAEVGGVQAFVATKPLQIVTSLIVARQLRPDRSRLSVVPQFADGQAIVRRLAKHVRDFDDIQVASSRIAALARQGLGGAARVFIDSDVGVKTPTVMQVLRLLRPSLRFALYEEGISLARPFDRDGPGRLTRALGATTSLGESSLIDEVWTYAPGGVRARLPQKRVRQILPEVAAFLADEHDLVTRVFWPDLERHRQHWTGGECSIYLSGWDVDRRALAHLARSADFSILKLHPHIRGERLAPLPHVDQFLPASVPAELVVYELARVFERVEVLHHDSTTARYIHAANIHFTNLDGAIANARTADARRYVEVS